MQRARSPHERAASVPRSYMGGFGGYFTASLYQNPEFPFWLTGSGKHITGRQFLILESAVFYAVFFLELSLAASPLAAPAAESSPYPNGFLWGAATAFRRGVQGNRGRRPLRIEPPLP